MSGEAEAWLSYADENLRVAKLCLDAGLFNPSIQNAQQATEKALKALRFARGIGFKRTHSIRELRDDVVESGLSLELTDEECDLLDSVYVPSKYPVHSVLPAFSPDERITRDCLTIAERVLAAAKSAAP